MLAARGSCEGPTALREIVPGIRTRRKYSEPHGYDFNGHLILDRAGNLGFDPIEPRVGWEQAKHSA